jgi:hypothetical protein
MGLTSQREEPPMSSFIPPWDNDRETTAECGECGCVQDTYAIPAGGWWDFGDCEECGTDLTPEDPRIP